MKTKLRKKYLVSRKTGNILIRLAIVIFTIIFIYDQLFYRKDLSSLLVDFNTVASGFWTYVLLLLTFLFIPLNLLTESVKWKYMIDKLEKVSLLNALRAVFAGISVSMLMPNRVGDYLGRVFILKKADRLQAVLVTILGNLALLITTIILGLIALVFYFPEYIDISISFNLWMYIGVIAAVIVSIFMVVFSYLNFSIISILLQRISGKYFKKIEKYSQVFSWYNQKELLNVLLLSILRYLVFSFQFYILLRAFNVNIDYMSAMMLIAVVYFIMTIIPTIALTEIGVRGSVSLYVFQHHFESLGSWGPEIALGVISASSVLWLFNRVLPAGVGTIFVVGLKFFRKNNGN